MPVTRVLVANRGEIAVRIVRACRAMGVETVLAASLADRHSLPARLADRAVCIGPPSARESYLNIDLIVTAALGTGCDAVHPGYGFLAESAELAAACAKHGLTFIGPKPDQIRRMGHKLQARALAAECGVPTLPGSQKVATPAEASAVAERIGYPVMLKAAAGGGGRGMKIVTRAGDLETMFRAASAEARAAFGDDTLYLERYIANARHVEVQVLGDAHGHVLHLGERDCSMQRRHQKLVEESPAPGLAPSLRAAIHAAAVTLARNIAYENAGTVEFIVDADAGGFFFLEMNTRIQVEHPVTELVTGFDLVQAQLRIARGEALEFTQADVRFDGHAIECRVNAEWPEQDFRPSPGRIATWRPPEAAHIRVDTHCHAGYQVPMYYDSMLAKLIVHGADREQAVSRMLDALARFQVEGVGTTLPFLQALVGHEAFRAGRVNTQLAEALASERRQRHSAGGV